MRTSKFKRLAWLLLVIVLAITPFSKTQTAAAQATGPRVGIVCTSDAGGGTHPTFNMTTNTGHIVLPDGNTMYMWGFSAAGGGFQYPGPVLCVNKGDTVTITLQNTLAEDTSIMFPGQVDVLANGAPAQPQFNGGGTLTSLTNAAAANGGSITYSFVANKPGSFIYESGTDPKKQVGMGLFGALIVRPALGADYAFDLANSRFTASEEFMVLLSEIDPYMHQAVEAGAPYDMNNYHAHYWLINGRGFPDSIADNFASWLPNQPYGSLALIHPYDPSTHPLPGIAHYLNVGTEDFPFHPHGNNGLVIGRDGSPVVGPSGEDASFEKFAINIGPGQTWDVLMKWYDAEQYDEVTNPIPVTVPDIANLTFGMFYSGSPYLGKLGMLPPGVSTLNQCGEYYIISHNHSLFQINSWGLTMSGPITYLRIDPPLPNNCP